MIRTKPAMWKPSTMARQRGLALVMVLWAAVLLALIAAGVTRLSRADLNLARNLVESTQAELAADSALRMAIYMIVNGGPEAWRIDGTVYAWRFGDAEVRVRVTDEFGRIDINAAPPELLSSLFVAAGAVPEDATLLADAVVEFRNQDVEDDEVGDTGRAPRGAEARFALTDELQRIPGMSRVLYSRIAHAITVYTRRALPKIEVASPLVLAAVEGREFVAPEDGEDVRATDETQALDDRPAVLGEPTESTTGVSGLIHVEAEALSAGGSHYAREAVIALNRRRELAYSPRLWRRGARVLFPALEEAR